MRIRGGYIVCALAVGLLFGLAIAGSEPTADDLAREIIRNQLDPETLDEMYVEAAQAASTNFQLAIQPVIKRAVTEEEKGRLLLFWHEQMKALLPYSAIQDLLVPAVTKNLSLEDLQEIKRFGESPAGRRYSEVQSVIVRESRAAGEQFGRKLADKDWQTKALEQLKLSFPQWFAATPASE